MKRLLALLYKRVDDSQIKDEDGGVKTVRDAREIL